MSSTLNAPISRRRHLGWCGTALTGLFVTRCLSAATTQVNLPPNPKFQPVYDALAALMRRLYEICRVKIDGRELLRPCASPYYNGVWHDDFTWSNIGLPELQKTPVMRDTIAWLTDAMVDFPVVADRKRHEWIDATGKPGGPEDFIGSLSMPLIGTRAILTGHSLLDDL